MRTGSAETTETVSSAFSGPAPEKATQEQDQRRQHRRSANRRVSGYQNCRPWHFHSDRARVGGMVDGRKQPDASLVQLAREPTHRFRVQGVTPPVNLRTGGDHPDRAHVVTDLPGWPRSCSGSPLPSMSWPAPAAWPRHCATCQPHIECDTVECAHCGDGPILTGALVDQLRKHDPSQPTALRAWLTSQGWQLEPEPRCPARSDSTKD